MPYYICHKGAKPKPLNVRQTLAVGRKCCIYVVSNCAPRNGRLMGEQLLFNCIKLRVLFFFFFHFNTSRFLEHIYLQYLAKKKKFVKDCLVCAVVTKGRQKFSN